MTIRTIWLQFTNIVIFTYNNIYLLLSGWYFSILSGMSVTVLYSKMHIFVMKSFKECFTVGEAGLASQAIIVLVYSLVFNIISFGKGDMSYRSNMQISTVIIQVSYCIIFFNIIFIVYIFQLGFLGIGTIAWTVYMLNIRKTLTLYSVSVLFIFVIILFPLHLLLYRSPLLWICQCLFHDTLSVSIVFHLFSSLSICLNNFVWS